MKLIPVHYSLILSLNKPATSSKNFPKTTCPVAELSSFLFFVYIILKVHHEDMQANTLEVFEYQILYNSSFIVDEEGKWHPYFMQTVSLPVLKGYAIYKYQIVCDARCLFSKGLFVTVK